MLLLAVDPLLQETREIVQEVLRSRRPDGRRRRACRHRLRELDQAIAAVADRVSRRYFTLLPIARSLGDGRRAAARGGVRWVVAS